MADGQDVVSRKTPQYLGLPSSICPVREIPALKSQSRKLATLSQTAPLRSLETPCTENWAGAWHAGGGQMCIAGLPRNENGNPRLIDTRSTITVMTSPSAKGVATDKRLQLESLFPSNTLAGMREFVGKVPPLSPLVRELIQVCFVLDANIVQGELRWRLQKRRNASAKSSLHEAIDSGIVVAVAPTFLKCEIEEHLPRIAVDTGVSVTKAREEWDEFQSHLHFYQPSSSSDPSAWVVDPDDLPYKDACEELGAAVVYSMDRDLSAMKVPVVSIRLDLTLRRHARAGSVAIGTTLGTGFTLLIGIEFVSALCRLIKRLVEGFRRLPGSVQLVIVTGVVAILIHPKSRAKLLDLWRSICTTVNAAKVPALGVAADVADQFFTARDTATQTYREIQAALPSRRKPSAIMLARTICAVSKEPLSLAEIERRMRNEGYSTRSANFSAYLRRVLCGSSQFVEVSPGLWTLQGLINMASAH